MLVKSIIDGKVYVAGHRGLVGSAIVRRLTAMGVSRIITRTHAELDLTNQVAVREFFEQERPDYVVLAAAKVGGIMANNTYPAEFIYENLMMECNVIHAAYQTGVTRLLFLGSSCTYPKLAEQPMVESALLTGRLEPTNEPYAIAKIAGMKLCESYSRQYGVDFRVVMPPNLYGPNDNFHPQNSHVAPALIRRICEAKEQGAKEVVVWGSGKAMREFLHVDDMASASLFVLGLDAEIYRANTDPMLSHINVGNGKDVSIRELAETICRVAGYNGQLVFDTSKPDGPLRKVMDVSRIGKMGWRASISLEDGFRDTYNWFVESRTGARQ